MKTQTEQLTLQLHPFTVKWLEHWCYDGTCDDSINKQDRRIMEEIRKACEAALSKATEAALRADR